MIPAAFLRISGTFSLGAGRTGGFDLLALAKCMPRRLKSCELPNVGSVSIVSYSAVSKGNILVNPEKRAVLADFGLAKSLDKPTGLSMSAGFQGTIRWASPEQLDAPGPNGVHTFTSDTWSFGMTALEVRYSDVRWSML